MAKKDSNKRHAQETVTLGNDHYLSFPCTQNIRDEITMKMMRITSQMKENCLHFIQKMCYAKSSVEYDGKYLQF